MKKIWRLIFLGFILLVVGNIYCRSGKRVGAQGQDNLESSPPAEEESLEGTVVRIEEESKIQPAGGGEEQLYQKLVVHVTRGSLQGEEITVESGGESLVNLPRYRVGDHLIIVKSKDFSGQDIFYVSDYVRRKPLALFLALFLFFTLLTARWQGLTSLLGMGFSFFIIFVFILPHILRGDDPVLVAMIGSLIIIPVTFYLAHGVNKKTTTAILGTLVSLLLVGVLSRLFVDMAHLSGFASEEAAFLQLAKGKTVNIRGLLLAGIIIGALGVLDDVTISQAAVVNQLNETQKKMDRNELYRRALAVGRDHVASMVNTLVLAYAGAFLPLLLLFVDNPHPFSEVINYEIVAEEIVRTLAGSIGLVLAVPFTTALAVWLIRKR